MPQASPATTTLPDRALIRLSGGATKGSVERSSADGGGGEDVRGFIDGLVTNALDVLPAYAALLTPQGKVIADFIVWADAADLLLDCDSAAAEALERRLAMYRLRQRCGCGRRRLARPSSPAARDWA